MIRFKARLISLSVTIVISGCVAPPKDAPKSPYLLLLPAELQRQSVRVEMPLIQDKRPADSRVTIQLDPGSLRLGDNLFDPSPATYVSQMLSEIAAAHPKRELLLQKLHSRNVELKTFDVILGTRSASPLDPKRLLDKPPMHASRAEVMLYSLLVRRWDVVRVKLRVSVGAEDFEAFDIHEFNPTEVPSPMSKPLRAALDSISNQLTTDWSEIPAR